jgi:hypothetical protein
VLAGQCVELVAKSLHQLDQLLRILLLRGSLGESTPVLSFERCAWSDVWLYVVAHPELLFWRAGLMRRPAHRRLGAKELQQAVWGFQEFSRAGIFRGYFGVPRSPSRYTLQDAGLTIRHVPKSFRVSGG